jgi:hypothetical protein
MVEEAAAPILLTQQLASYQFDLAWAFAIS